MNESGAGQRLLESAFGIGLVRSAKNAVVGESRVRDSERGLSLHVAGGARVRRLLGEALLQIERAAFFGVALQTPAAKIFRCLLGRRLHVRVMASLAAEFPSAAR